MYRVLPAPVAALLMATMVATAACGSATAPSTPTAAVTPSATPNATSTAQPAPSAGASTTDSSTSASPSDTPEPTMVPFVLTSTSFTAGGAIPRRFTCDGEDLSPDLAWDGAPDGTAALVLLVDDPDARGWVHWIVLDLPGAAIGSLPLGVGPSGPPRQGRNDFGRVGWGGPCPPSGTHRYTFTLYALAAPLGLSGTPGGDAVRTALAGVRVLGTAVLGGRYRRG